MSRQSEIEFFRRVCAKARRERYAELLASERGRRRVLDELYHFDAWDERAMVSIAPGEQNAEPIHRMLRRAGAPNTCLIMSTDSDFDGIEMPLAEALQSVVAFMCGVVLICDPAGLGYWEGEYPKDRCVLDGRR